jgi:hypothetical protein
VALCAGLALVLDEVEKERPWRVASVGLRGLEFVGKMEAIHGLGDRVAIAGIVARKLRVALRGKYVDGVGGAH